MPKIQILEAEDICLPKIDHFPNRIIVLADIKKCNADIDIIIGSHHQSQAVNLTVDNYLSLEKEKSLHIIVVESSKDPLNFWRIRSRENVSKVLILSEISCTRKKYGNH